MKQPLVIYHAHCTDGFGAAFAAWLYFKEAAEYLPASYGQIKSPNDLPDITDRDVYILDFSLDKSVTEHVVQHCAKFVMLDHHKTAFETFLGTTPEDTVCPYTGKKEAYIDTSGLKQLILDNNRSGAMLAWDYFHGFAEGPQPTLFVHIDDRDRWKFKVPYTKAIYAYLESQKPWSFEQWDVISRTMEEDDSTAYYNMVDQGKALLKQREQYVETIAKTGKRTASFMCLQEKLGHDNLVGLSANCPSAFASEVGHILANESGTFGFLWYLRYDGKISCSLRSNGDYDVSAIAKCFGGGGHKNAAGFEMEVVDFFSLY